MRIAAISCALLTLSWGALAHAQSSATVPVRAGAVSGAEVRALARQVAEDYVRRARESERTARVHSAQALFARAIESDPSYLPGYLGFARVLEARGHHAEALGALSAIPERALGDDDGLVELARARATLGDVEGSLAQLQSRAATPPALRALAELASLHQRFPTALAAARRLRESLRDADARERARADALSRALAQLVGESDAVRFPPRGSPPLRSALSAH